MDIEKLKASLTLSEGLELKPYKDNVGKTTIGIGRNLDDVGLTKEEIIILLKQNGITEAQASMLLENDIKKVEAQLKEKSEFGYLSQSEPRQRVIMEMAFNMGVSRLMGFKNMWEYIKEQKWDKAAEEMLNSQWARQVKGRAKRLADAMRTGTDNKITT